MKSKLKTVFFMAVAVATGLVSGCGGSGGGTASTSGAAPATAATAPSSTSSVSSQAEILYAGNCADCHGALNVSTKKGITLARLQNAIANNIGGMGFLSALSAADQQTIVTVLASMTTTPTTPVSTPTQTPTPTTPTTTIDGAALYAANCQGCHGALASSAKRGATAAQIQVRMYTAPYATRTLTPAEVQAIADALAITTTTPPPTTTTPPPTTAVCGSCHAIPPATGKHAFHASQSVTCATCHGSGYSTTTFNAATHNNGVKNLTTTIGWNATSRSCSNSCHGSKSW